MTNFIGIFNNALSSYKCKEIIKYIDKSELFPGGFDGGIVNKKVKDSLEVSDQFFSKLTWVDNYLLKSLNDNLEKYKQTHPQLNIVSEWKVDDGYNLQKYNPGQGFFGSHCEAGNKSDSKRLLAWMFYLNTVTNGGGTRFDNYNKTFKAREGRLLIWPGYWTHMHHGIVSKTQTKYIATGWFSYV